MGLHPHIPVLKVLFKFGSNLVTALPDFDFNAKELSIAVMRAHIKPNGTTWTPFVLNLCRETGCVYSSWTYTLATTLKFD